MVVAGYIASQIDFVQPRESAGGHKAKEKEHPTSTWCSQGPACLSRNAAGVDQNVNKHRAPLLSSTRSLSCDVMQAVCTVCVRVLCIC